MLSQFRGGSKVLRGRTGAGTCRRCLRDPARLPSAILPSLPAAFSDPGSLLPRLLSAITPSALPSRSPQPSRFPSRPPPSEILPPSRPAPCPLPSAIPPSFPAPALSAPLPSALPHFPPFPSRSPQRSRLPPRPLPAVLDVSFFLALCKRNLCEITCTRGVCLVKERTSVSSHALRLHHPNTCVLGGRTLCSKRACL